MSSNSNSTDFIETTVKRPSVYYHQLFQYATMVEILLTILGILSSALSGILFPVGMIYFADSVDVIVLPGTNILESIKTPVKIYCIIGGISLIFGFLQAFLLKYVAERQANRIRLLYFKSVLRQDVPWHEIKSVGSIITEISENVDQLEEGIGINLSIFIRDMNTFLVGIIISFTYGWKLTCVAIALMPVVSLVFTALALVIVVVTKEELSAYSRASDIAAEALSSFRTVISFGGEESAVEKYSNELGDAQKAGVKKGYLLGVCIGMIGLSIFSIIAAIFYYGVVLIVEDAYKPGTVVLIIMNLVYGSIAVGRSMPLVEFFIRATATAAVVFDCIERIPPIDIDNTGTIPESFKGEIEFKNVSFTYPQRKEVPILKNFNLTIKFGEVVAIVGPSGSGKSTLVQLLQRFYDVDDGQILIDDNDLRNLNVPWLRKQFGVVSQEPILFSGTVKENIRMGYLEATDKSIEKAARLANAHNFITNDFPNGYDTWLSERGGSLSGGQKQRIAIARALVKDPQILLLDEATSALDTRSERIVQEALENVTHKRTVLIIAHRLTTVRKAHRIIVMDRGKIKENGTHEELVKLKKIYFNMLSKSNENEHTKSDQRKDNTSKMFAKHDFKDNKSWTKNDQKSFEEDEKLKKNLSNSAVTWRALKMSKPEACILSIGFLMSGISGTMEPFFALLNAETFEVFIRAIITNKVPYRAVVVAGLMSAIGFVKLISVFLQYSLLSIAGERLIKRARKLLFQSMLKQEAGWFDASENQSGILTARLANDVPAIRKVSGERGGVIMESIMITVISLIVAFYFSWHLALVNMAFMPALVIAGSIQVSEMTSKVGQALVQGSEIVQESLSSQRVVASMGLEPYFYELFRNKSCLSKRSMWKSQLIFAIVNAIGQGLQFFQTAAVFYVGAILITDETITKIEMFRSITVISFGAQGLGRAASFLPDLNRSINGAREVFKIVDRESKLPCDVGKIPPEPLKCEIKFRDVHFAYPTRSDTAILQGFSHDVVPGSTTAFVGQSGCGKSTVLLLLQRLYDSESKNSASGVFIDDTNVQTIQPTWLRRQIGIVSQEPNLFDMSIADNIAYGQLYKDVKMGDIIKAAKDANIHQFIKSLPLGYDTQIGFRGGQLSGGQKQRIAIARALIRKPKILLLDEATSALDTESERIVQTTLDKAMLEKSRTSLVVAHRLTTVENCDTIVVIKDGVCIEKGSPDKLMAKKGAYYELHNVDAVGVKK